MALGEEIVLGGGELRSGGETGPSILANALEAIIGAVFVDAGFDAARTVIERIYAAEFASLDPTTLGKDPKTRTAGVAAGPSESPCPSTP
jgi:ribonuclease-3